MRNVFQRDGTWWVRINVPADLQAAWGKTAEWRSLQTSDELEAIASAPPVIKEIKGKIRALRAAGAMAPEAAKPSASATPARLTPDQAHKRIKAWRDAQFDEGLLQAYNGELQPLSELDDRQLKAKMDSLATHPEQVEGFSELHAHVLGMPLGHPALRHSVRQFAERWLEVLWTIDTFRKNPPKRWPISDPDDPSLTPESAAAPSAHLTPTLLLSALLERFIASQSPAEEADVRYVWRRFTEFVGDVDARSVTRDQAEAWVLAVKRFPVTRRPEVMDKDIRSILSDHAGGNVLSPKTAWKWAGTVNRVFAYAERFKLVEDNPMAVAMPKKPGRGDQKKKRRSYTAAEIQLLFAKPLFTGFAGTGKTGYRERPGGTTVKDAKYWLPIFALWHGCRMEEIGGAKISELKVVNKVTYFDWLERDLKTEDSSRLVPLHPMMRNLGFLDYIAERRAAGDEYVFQDLPHDSQNATASTAQFGKWWARWCDANGLSDNGLDFHAFRHTFIEACRGKMDEEIRDFLVGHKGQGSMGRAYGDVPLKVLSTALARVKFDTFPILPR